MSMYGFLNRHSVLFRMRWIIATAVMAITLVAMNRTKFNGENLLLALGVLLGTLLAIQLLAEMTTIPPRGGRYRYPYEYMTNQDGEHKTEESQDEEEQTQAHPEPDSTTTEINEGMTGISEAQYFETVPVEMGEEPVSAKPHCFTWFDGKMCDGEAPKGSRSPCSGPEPFDNQPPSAKCFTGNVPNALCSQPNPDTKGLITATIGSMWQVQTADAVQKRLASGNYVPSTCDLQKQMQG